MLELRQSESIAELAGALAQAQGEIENAAKDAVNPHFKSRYADLAAVREAIRGPFARHGLAVTQFPILDQGGPALATMLLHKSGEWLCGVMPLVGRLDQPQAFGSALTYARRYALSAVAGIASEEDDDATLAQAHTQARANGHAGPSFAPDPRPQPPKREIATDVRPMVRYVTDRVTAAAEDWDRYEREEKVPRELSRKMPILPRTLNHLASAAAKAGAIDPAEILDPVTGKRDDLKGRQALARLFARDPDRVKQALEAYLERHWDENVAAVAPAAGDPADVDYPDEPGMNG